jgi:hypothetical protein
MANKFTDAVFKAKLTGTLKLVLYALAHRADNNTGRCWPSFQRIAEDSGIGRQTAVDGVAALLKIGLVKVVGLHDNERGQPSNEYELSLEKLTELATSDEYAFRSKPRKKNHNGSRTGTGDELVREPGRTITGAVTQPVREPLRTITGDDNELINELPTENTSLNSAAAQNINISIPHRSNSHSYSADAENLSRLFHSLLESNPNVKFIQKNWQQVFPADIEKLVEGYGPDWAERIIRVSQTTSWSKYILRSATLIEKAPELYELAVKLERKKLPAEEDAGDEFGEAESFTTVPADDEEEDFG